MTAKEQSIGFIKQEGILKIPFFQRAYIWETKHWEKIWIDLYDSYDQNHIHFLGSIIIKQLDVTSGSKKECFIIEGQQRLTSLTLLLLAIYHIDNNRKSEIDRMIFTDTQGKEKTLILKQIQKDEAYLSQIISNTERLHKENSNIINNYLFFYDFITENTEKIDLIMQGLNRLRFVHIELEISDQPQLVFETLNATGKDLVRLIKFVISFLCIKSRNICMKTIGLK